MEEQEERSMKPYQTHNGISGGGREPGLDDMLSDPVTQAVMTSDGVAPEEIKSLLLDARRRYSLHSTVMASTQSCSVPTD
jgi:hypothetical protein